MQDYLWIVQEHHGMRDLDEEHNQVPKELDDVEKDIEI